MPEEPFAIDAFSTSQAHRESAELEVLAEEFARLSSSPNTVRAYRADWRAFSTWCSKRGYLALPASAHTVILYATHAAAREHLSRATILRRMATIRNAHESRGLPSPVSDPTTRAVLAGIRRTKAASPELARAPVTEDPRQLLRHVPTDTLPGLRDQALLLLGLGYASGCTRGCGAARATRRGMAAPSASRRRAHGNPPGERAYGLPGRGRDLQRPALQGDHTGWHGPLPRRVSPGTRCAPAWQRNS